MERVAKIANSFLFSKKLFILYVLQGSEYASGMPQGFLKSDSLSDLFDLEFVRAKTIINPLKLINISNIHHREDSFHLELQEDNSGY